MNELKFNYVVDILDPKSPSLGIFNFRALLNISMLVTESQTLFIQPIRFNKALLIKTG
jgi:hypothetical protein